MAKRKSKKKNQRNKLLLLILLLSLSVLLLVMSTYAWFTSNRNVSVETLDVNVSTVNGLQISTDASNWKARVLKTDIQNASYTSGVARNFLPDVLDHMSTAGNVTGGYLDMYHGVVSANEATGIYTLTTTKTRETSRTGSCTGTACAAVMNSDGVTIDEDQILFVAFDLYFKVDAATPIVLTKDSKVDQVRDTSDPTDVDTGIKNTVRVAFVYEGNVGPGSSAASAQALNAGSNVIIWEPNMDTHTQAGIINATTNYGVTPTASGGSALSYKGVNSVIPSPGVNISQTNSSAYFTTVNPTIKTAYGFTTDQTFTTLAPGITKYRVYWWVEGQDVDTENGATGKHMTLDLAFSIA